jgi:hypothetical protein
LTGLPSAPGPTLIGKEPRKHGQRVPSDRSITKKHRRSFINRTSSLGVSIFVGLLAAISISDAKCCGIWCAFMVYFRLLLGSTRNTSKLQMRPRIICQEKDKEPDFNVSKVLLSYMKVIWVLQ